MQMTIAAITVPCISMESGKVYPWKQPPWTARSASALSGSPCAKCRVRGVFEYRLQIAHLQRTP